MKINDFDEFSWTQVQDFAKIVEFLERSLSRNANFSCFLTFDHVLERSLPRYGIMMMILQRFFNFRTIFDDFDQDDTILVTLFEPFLIVLWHFQHTKNHDF